MDQSKRMVKGRPGKSRQKDVAVTPDTLDAGRIKLADARAREAHSTVPPNTPLEVVSNKPSGSYSRASTSRVGLPSGLSLRAENVLKELAAELVGENPPQGSWTPPDVLVQRLTYKDIATARNCGPQTTAEIIEWARRRGRIIQRPFHAGKSLSAIWQYTIAKFSEGNISRSEVIEALEKSTRRGNTRIPVEFQKMLLQFVYSSE